VASTLRVDLLTLFPGLFDSFLAESLVERAIAREFLAVHRWDLRDWSEGRHRQVDDRPFGGGPGMVLMAPPVVAAVEAVRAIEPSVPGRLLLMTPAGRPFDQPFAAELAREQRLLLLCGRYEGFDHRILQVLEPEPVSIGPYVLSGGEVPAMAIIEAVMRLRPGVLGDAASAVDESFGPEASSAASPSPRSSSAAITRRSPPGDADTAPHTPAPDPRIIPNPYHTIHRTNRTNEVFPCRIT
jgi:tRNA (guanine37-N1)-methyltransferase